MTVGDSPAPAEPVVKSKAAGVRRRPYPVWLKPLVFVAGLAPPGTVAFRFFTDRYGANPIAAALNDLGLFTLIALLVALAATPANRLSAWGRHLLAKPGVPARPGWAWPLALRRMLGLFAFFYVILHFTFYLAIDQGFDWGEILKDITKRKFITVGFSAFVLLVPLAATSFARMVKALGFKAWKRLHRLAYVAAVLGVVHFLWREKVPGVEQWAYAGVLAALLAVRFLPRPARPRSPLPSS